MLPYKEERLAAERSWQPGHLWSTLGLAGRRGQVPSWVSKENGGFQLLINYLSPLGDDFGW